MASPNVRKNNDVEELRIKLDAGLLKKDKVLIHQLIRRVIEYMTLGLDVSQLFFTMIKAAATSDVIQKKLVYLYICTQAESNAESALLTVNTLVNDSLDPSDPKIRGLALRSMFNMRLSNLVEHMKEPLLKGLNDNSSYVRHIAVMCCLKLYKITPILFNDLSLHSNLLKKINDPDGQVSFNAICCLDEILQADGGLKFDKDLITFLLFQRFPNYNEWHQSILLGKLQRYTPESIDEVVKYLNVLDPKLRHTNKAVVMATLTLFLKWTEPFDDLKNDVITTVSDTLLALLKSCTPEMQITLLNHVYIIIKTQPKSFSDHYKTFFVKYDESACVKYKKLQILLNIITHSNIMAILSEIREYIFQPDNQLTSWSLKLICEISLRYSFSLNHCVDIFIECINSGLEFLTASALENLQVVMKKYDGIVSTILPELDSCWELVQSQPNGKESLIWIYGEYGEAVDTAPYKLEEIVDNIHDEKSSTIKFTLLTSLVKLFLKRPPECGEMLKKYLQYCIDEEKHLGIRDKALFYLRTIQNIPKMEKLFEKDSLYNHSEEKTINNDSMFPLDEFNTLSVLYGHSNKGTSTITKNEYFKKSVGRLKVNGKVETHYEPSEVVVENILNLQDESTKSNEDGENEKENFISKDLSRLDNKTHSEEINNSGETNIVFFEDIKLSPKEFEKIWEDTNTKKVCEQHLALPSHPIFLEQMQRHHFYLLASSPPTKAKKRYLFYAKTTSEVWIVCEISFNDGTSFSTWTLKSYNESVIHQCFNIVKKILEGR